MISALDKWATVTAQPTWADDKESYININYLLYPRSADNLVPRFLECKSTALTLPQNNNRVIVHYLTVPFAHTYSVFNFDGWTQQEIVRLVLAQAMQPGCNWFPIEVGANETNVYRDLRVRVDATMLSNDLYMLCVYTILMTVHQWVLLQGLTAVQQQFRMPTEQEISGLWLDTRWETKLQGLMGFTAAMGDVNEKPKSA